MNIRRANEKDIPRLVELLEQVLQIHADIRPDIFIPGTTKYTNDEFTITSLFFDDLCVDAKTRGQHVGESLFEYVKSEAKRLGCYEVTLNVWSGNTSAEKFYEKMGLKTKERQMEYIL